MKPNRRAILTMIATCEGTGDCYNALFGYHPTLRPTRIFENGYVRHPNIKFPFTQTDGTLNFTTAAGRYQFIFPTWEMVADRIGAPDFSPEWQDEGALSQIEYHEALDDVDEGHLQRAIDKISVEWASLPSSRYPQPKRSFAFALAAFEGAGGMLA
jgi:muramidase (phage lysozyme)